MMPTKKSTQKTKLVRKLTVTIEAPNHEVLAMATRAFGRSLAESSVDTFSGDEVGRSKEGWKYTSKWDTREYPGDVE